MEKTRREIILDTIKELVPDPLYYDPKIEEALYNNEISIEDMVIAFRHALKEGTGS